MTLDLTPTEVLAGLGVLMTVFMVWRAGVRRARRAAGVARSGGRLLSLGGRVLALAGLIVGVQWLVISHPAADPWLVLAVLGMPALFASYALTKALTVTTSDRGGRR